MKTWRPIRCSFTVKSGLSCLDLSPISWESNQRKFQWCRSILNQNPKSSPESKTRRLTAPRARREGLQRAQAWAQAPRRARRRRRRLEIELGWTLISPINTLIPVSKYSCLILQSSSPKIFPQLLLLQSATCHNGGADILSSSWTWWSMGAVEDPCLLPHSLMASGRFQLLELLDQVRKKLDFSSASKTNWRHCTRRSRIAEKDEAYNCNYNILYIKQYISIKVIILRI